MAAVLRYLLVQDWDLDEDGEPETLRLMFGTRVRWLEDGKVVTVEGAPTSFGPVSARLQSKLSEDQVIAEIDLPVRNPAKHAFLRIRLPEGWKIVSAKVENKSLSPDGKGTVDLSNLQGKHTIVFQNQARLALLSYSPRCPLPMSGPSIPILIIGRNIAITMLPTITAQNDDHNRLEQ